MAEELAARLRALERAVSDQQDPPAPIPDVATVSTTVEELEGRLDTLETTVADLAARQQAVEAYVDRVEHVDESVERRADAALAAVDRLESEGCGGGEVGGGGEAGRAVDAEAARSSSLPADTAPGPAHVADAATTTDTPDEADSDTGIATAVFRRLVGQ